MKKKMYGVLLYLLVSAVTYCAPKGWKKLKSFCGIYKITDAL